MNHTTPSYPIIYPAGDSAYVVEFGSVVDPVLNQKVLQLDAELTAQNIAGITELVPSYRSLLIQFNPLVLARETLVDLLNLAIPKSDQNAPTHSNRYWRVPVCYDAEFALDMAEVCKYLNLSKHELIAHHSGAQYRVYMLGFLPGYTYLGGLPKSLIIPRKDTPRPRVEAGTIAMAGNQACVFSTPAPTGWHVLGRTPLLAFDPNRDPPCLFEPGDIIRYIPIERTEYDNLIARAENGDDIATAFLSKSGDQT